MQKKLHRSASDKKIFGVCGGFAEYFDCDSTLVRLAAVIIMLCFGSGLLIYILCAIIMPVQQDEPIEYEYIHKERSEHDTE